MPDAFAALTKLQQLALSDNRLSGPLPAFLGALPALRGAQLGGNNFTGPLPPAWCANNATYGVEGNADLCGIVPACLEARGVAGAAALAGTFLMPAGNLSLESGGYCDDSPPSCDLDVGCRVMAPAFSTAAGAVDFNFTGFVDAHSGPLSYRWGLGTAPGRDDVLPAAPFNGERARGACASVGAVAVAGLGSCC